MFGLVVGVVTLAVLSRALPAGPAPLSAWMSLLALAGAYAACLLVWSGLGAVLGLRYPGGREK